MKKLLSLLLISFLLPSVAFGAIAFDAASNSGSTCWTGSNGTTCSDTHVTGSLTNGILIAGATAYFTSGGHSAATGCTYNGVAMTKINSIAGTADAVAQDISLWQLVNPTSGSNTLTCTWAAAAQYAAVSGATYSGVSQSTPIDSSGTGQSGTSGSAAATSLTVSTTVNNANEWLVGTVEARGSQPAAGTGTTLRGLNTSAWSSGGDSNGTVSTGSQSLQWTSTNGAWPGGVVAALEPYSAPVAPSSLVNLFITGDW